MSFSRVWFQFFNIPKPTLTEANLPDQTNRVIIITGGYVGCGLELARLLYQRNATLYLAGRTEDKAKRAISEVRKEFPNSKGRLEFLQLDLNDLTTIKPTVNAFLAKEQRLDVLVNNAGVMRTPIEWKGPQGHEYQITINCLGAYLLTQLLLPVLQKTAASSPLGSVRVCFAGSLATEVGGAPKGGINMSNNGDYIPHATNTAINYSQSKVGNLYLGSQFAVRHPLDANGKGVIFNSFNPGNLRTELGRYMEMTLLWRILLALLTYPPKLGGYTELYAACAEEAGRKERNGGYILPWGRFGAGGGVKDDLAQAMEAGRKGEGPAAKFFEWCERETKAYQ